MSILGHPWLKAGEGPAGPMPVAVGAITSITGATTVPRTKNKIYCKKWPEHLCAFWALEYIGILDEGGGVCDVDPLDSYEDKITRKSGERYVAQLP